jgi:hypothetical protein
MSDEEYRAREDLVRLIDRLQSLERWLPEGSVGPSEVYEPEGVRIYVSRYRGEPELEQPEVPWPLAMPLATIGDDTDLGYRCTVITGEDWATLLPEARSANQLTPWTSDGKRYAVAFVPLLPDAEGC